MKVNRRSFFSVAAAAPVAAKQAVSALAYEAKAQGLNAGLMAADYRSIGGSIGGPSDGGWMQQELKALLHRRSKLENEPLPEHVSATSEAMGIDGLRSVAGPVRARMIAEARRRRELAIERSYIDRMITEYREKLGSLGALFE